MASVAGGSLRPDAQAEQDQWDCEHPVARIAVDLRENQNADRGDHHAADDGRPDADQRSDPPTDNGADRNGNCQGQQTNTGFECAVAEDELELL